MKSCIRDEPATSRSVVFQLKRKICKIYDRCPSLAQDVHNLWKYRYSINRLNYCLALSTSEVTNLSILVSDVQLFTDVLNLHANELKQRTYLIRFGICKVQRWCFCLRSKTPSALRRLFIN